jgi:GTP-binding protein
MTSSILSRESRRHLPRTDSATPQNGRSPGGEEKGRGLPVVAIVGRPNVGKSTLFNRIVRGRPAIVDNAPGVTRDRNYRATDWAGKSFLVVDTGGLVPRSDDRIESLVRKQVETAIEEAAVVVLVVDGAAGVTHLDREVARVLRKKARCFLLVVNKLDTKKAQAQADEFYELGLGDFFQVSAEHGVGMTELLDAVIQRIPTVRTAEEHIAAIAVVGRPNVGKSSLVNRLAGGDAVIVHDEPGTTRDSVDTVIKTRRGLVRLVDTAGLRRKSRTDSELEKYANLRSIGAIDRSDVVALMLDAGQEIAKQDLNIATYVERAGKGMVIAWNKWDLRERADKPGFTEHLQSRFRKTPYLPVTFTSCVTGEGISELLGLCLKVNSELDAKISTGVLNRAVLAASARKPPTGRGFPKIYYAAQTGTRPPAFTLFVNNPELFTETYRRHVEKIIRAAHPFTGVPLRIRVRISK